MGSPGPTAVCVPPTPGASDAACSHPPPGVLHLPPLTTVPPKWPLRHGGGPQADHLPPMTAAHCSCDLSDAQVAPEVTIAYMTQSIMPQHANTVNITFGGQVRVNPSMLPLNDNENPGSRCDQPPITPMCKSPGSLELSFMPRQAKGFHAICSGQVYMCDHAVA